MILLDKLELIVTPTFIPFVTASLPLVWVTSVPLKSKFIAFIPLPSPPVNNFLVLYSVLLAILFISEVRLLISFWIAFLSLSLLVSLIDCTESSLILWRIELVSFNAPSAVWINVIPSPAFLEACSNPLICALIFSEIERPATSSPALLILNPELNFSIDLDESLPFTFMFLPEFIAPILWFIFIISSSVILKLYTYIVEKTLVKLIVYKKIMDKI